MKKIASLYLSCLLLLAANRLYAQAPPIQWQKCLGGHMGDYGQYIEPTSDGGYIMTGYTASNDVDVSGNHGLDDYWVVKLNSTGGIQWQKCLGGNSEDRANMIHQTPDGGYIVAGSAFSNNGDVTGNHNSMDCWIVKLSSTGSIQWQKSFGGSKNEYAYSIQLTTDGGYIVAGLTESNDGDVTGNHGGRDYWVVKLSSTGALQWQKTYGGSADEEAYSVQLAPDGGYIVAGFTQSNNGDVSGNHGNTDCWVVKISSTGALQWQKSLGGTLYETAWCVQATVDGGYIVAGTASSNDGDVSGNHVGFAVGFSDYWIVKLSSTGSIQWQKCLGGNYNETAYALQLTADGGYIVAGSAESVDGDVSCHVAFHDYWVAKINATGDLQWSKDMGGSAIDEAYSICPTSDGGYILNGLTSSTEQPGYHTDYNSTVGDAWVIKLGPPQAAPAPPSLTITPHNPVICQGLPLTLTVTPHNPGNYFHYQWKKNGVNVGTDGAAYTDASFADQDVVVCEMTTSDCALGSITVSDQVVITTGGAPPSIHIDADASTLCSGTLITFTALVAHAGASPVYQWKVNGIATGTNSNSFSTNTLSDGAIVTCSYTDNNPCMPPTPVVSNAIPLQVTSSGSPSVSIAVPQSKICAGTEVSFTATAVNGGANASYQWTVNGNIVSTSGPLFTTTALTDGSTVNCTLTADPALHCLTTFTATSNNIVMAVRPAEPPTIRIQASKNAVCYGTLVNFIATTTNAGTAPSYQWKINGADADGRGPSLTRDGFHNGDVISCLLTPDKDACSIAPLSSDPVSMLIYDLPEVTIIPADTTIKAGQSITLNALVTGSLNTFEWQPEDQLLYPQSLVPTTVPMAASTTFLLKVVSADGCSTRSKANVKVIRPLVIPNAFSPNGDGKNDVFRIPPDVPLTLREFSIFDRWGHRVFTTRNIAQGWDGRINGELSPPGVYVYMIDGVGEKGNVVLKGTVLLIR